MTYVCLLMRQATDLLRVICQPDSIVEVFLALTYIKKWCIAKCEGNSSRPQRIVHATAFHPMKQIRFEEVLLMVQKSQTPTWDA